MKQASGVGKSARSDTLPVLLLITPLMLDTLPCLTYMPPSLSIKPTLSIKLTAFAMEPYLRSSPKSWFSSMEK